MNQSDESEYIDCFFSLKKKIITMGGNKHDLFCSNCRRRSNGTIHQ